MNRYGTYRCQVLMVLGSVLRVGSYPNKYYLSDLVLKNFASHMYLLVMYLLPPESLKVSLIRSHER